MKIDRLELASSIFAALVLANLGLHFKIFESKDAIWFPLDGAVLYLLAMFIAAGDEYFE